MGKFIVLIGCAVCLLSCASKKPEQAVDNKVPLIGTWQLISGTTIDKGDTTVTEYTKDQSFIKIINATHFAFLKHDLTGGKGKTATYDSGGGTYTLKDSLYTENLMYCTEREWENHSFTFTVTIRNDTLRQQGVEVIEKAGINRLNIETYVKAKR